MLILIISDIGIAKVNFILPDVECTYEVALLVNSTIDNEKDCRNHVFHTTDSYEDEIHSVERTICVLPSTNHTKRTSCQVIQDILRLNNMLRYS